MIYGIGETVFDIIFRHDQPQRAVPGGSTFNSMISLGRCGHHPTMATETGDDHIGRLILRFMEENGVGTDLVTVNPGTKTHLSLAFLNEQNDAQYQFYKDHASASVEPRFPDFKANDVVLFGSFFAINPAIRAYTREFLQRAHRAGCTLYYDVNFRASHIKDLPEVLGNLEENMRLATIVRGSTEDFGYIYGTATPPATLYRERIAPLCPTLICTDGSKGVSVMHGAMELHYPTAPITTVSTIGAGDNFNAGVVHAIATQGITRADLQAPTEALIASLVGTGQEFAAKVCQSWENYIPIYNNLNENDNANHNDNPSSR